MHVCISHLRSLLGHWLRFDTDELVHKGLIWRKDVFMYGNDTKNGIFSGAFYA